MNFIFRCDSTLLIGSGHLMRCLALAQKIRSLGHKVAFICAPHEEDLFYPIVQAQISLTFLSSCNLDQKSDAAEVKKIVKELQPAVIVVDHYELGEEWETEFYGEYKVIAIDDLGRAHKADVLIDVNYRQKLVSLYERKLPKSCLTFLGPQNSLLRAEFLNCIEIAKKRRQILVFFGGADSSNETYKFVQALQKRSSNAYYVIVVSRGHRFLTDILEIGQSPYFRIEIQPPLISKLMSESSLFFGSGGTITWERMFLGLPGIVVSVADNQKKIAEDLAADGQQIFLGECGSVDYGRAIEICENILDDDLWLNDVAKKNKKLVQALNVSELVWGVGCITLRKATLEDGYFLYELRNEPVTRQMSLSSQEFSFENHVEWLRKRIHSDDPIYIILYKGDKVGQVRIDADCTISIAICPKYRGFSFASQAICVATEVYSRSEHSWPLKYVAIIKKQNFGSVKAFERAGFVFETEIQIQNEICFKYVLLKGNYE